jgi:hypothetical protein
MSSVDPNELERSLNSIAGMLQAELDEALQQKVNIKLRMRSLRRHLGILEAKSNGKSASRAKFHRARSAVRRALAQEMSRAHEELWRACRIAFLELGGTATPEELYSAIARRKSFSFAAIGDEALIAVRRVLNSMLQSGEVVSSAANSPPQWTYKGVARCR